MKRELFAVCLVVLALSEFASGFQNAAEWTKYNSSEGRYSALVPQQPKLSTQEATSPAGDKYTQYMAQTSDSESVYFMGYFDHPSDKAFSLDAARDGMLESSNGTLIREEAVSLGGKPGKGFRFSTKSGEIDLIVSARIYDIGNRVYVIQHIFRKASDTSAIDRKTQKFFDSFAVTTAAK